MTHATLEESTLIMVDDNIDEIFLTRRLIRRDGIINRFISEKKPERLFQTLEELIATGMDKDSFVILLDINMPRMNGFETLQAIRNHPEYKDMPVFMLSASKDDVDMLEAEELGCDGYLTKPFSADEFFAELQHVSQVKKRIYNDPKAAPPPRPSKRAVADATTPELTLVA